ncbi:hypothetical protein AB0J14_28195 [Micromonospora arborensis]|uniref:hypothetical protein n=1 Tax=Micromonospora arborensis TaxID=2116518 RepID=UPI0033FD843E
MAVHVGEVTSQVEVQGMAGSAPVGRDHPSVWERHEQYRRQAEEEEGRRARVAGEGFDG